MARLLGFAFGSALGMVFSLAGLALYLLIGTWAVSVCATEFFGHPLQPWWLNTLAGVLLMGPATALAIIITVLGWLGLLFSHPSSQAYTVATTTAAPNVVQQCMDDAADHRADARRFYDVCTKAATISRTSVQEAPDEPALRDDLRSSEALMILYAGGAASELGKRDEAKEYIAQAKSIWTNLAAHGYSEHARRQSRLALSCFFDQDQDACHSLFPKSK